MTWYFNNDGAADGPYDDEAMAALLAQKRIQGGTLIWHPEAERWQEITVVAPSWWAKLSVEGTPPKAAPHQDGPATSRRLAPMAPRQEKEVAEKGVFGFFKRVFGLGRDK